MSDISLQGARFTERWAYRYPKHCTDIATLIIGRNLPPDLIFRVSTSLGLLLVELVESSRLLAEEDRSFYLSKENGVSGGE